MKHPHAVSLAKRLLDSHLKLHIEQPVRVEPIPTLFISADQLSQALEILATHLDACMKQGVHPDLTEAVEDAVDFAVRNERAYEPIPHGLRWHSALVVMEERDAD